MDIQQICNTYRPILLRFFQTRRTYEDAMNFYLENENIEVGKEFLDIFYIMSTDNSEYSKELKEVAEKLTIGFLRYPQIQFDLLEYIEKYKQLTQKVETIHIDLSKINNEIDIKYWNRILEDMEEDYYDDFLKNLLAVRKELLDHLVGTGYNSDTIMEYMDIEFIKQNLYIKSYRFSGLFEFIQQLILSKLHPILKETFNKLCDDFKKNIDRDSTSNKVAVLYLQFIINYMIDFLYLDVETL